MQRVRFINWLAYPSVHNAQRQHLNQGFQPIGQTLLQKVLHTQPGMTLSYSSLQCKKKCHRSEAFFGLGG